ncbi:MAG: hypothetical protein ACU0CY_15515 [Maritimibacter harenae]
MKNFRRYAACYAAGDGPFARFMADWLGWSPLSGSSRPHPTVPGVPHPVDEITSTPRKYGFFRLRG